MNLVEIRRQHTKWAIDQNPITITIERTIKTKKQGYIDDEKMSVGPFVVRLYTVGGAPLVQVETQGERMIDRYYNMLMDYTAEPMANINTTDRFTVNDITYEIVAVWPQTIHGKVVGYQCDVERVM